jgi:hypothetical protein
MTVRNSKGSKCTVLLVLLFVARVLAQAPDGKQLQCEEARRQGVRDRARSRLRRAARSRNQLADRFYL